MSQKRDQMIHHYRGGRTGDVGVTEVIIEPGVTVIDGCAFANCNELIRVTIPGSVTVIEEAAFANCTSLEEITIPEGITAINADAFYACNSLQRVELPDSLTEIGSWAFANCEELRHINIPTGVTIMGEHAFQSTGIEEIAIPDGLKKIPKRAFFRCLALHTVHLHASLEEFDFETFSCCFNLEKFVYPDGLPLFYELDLAFYDLERRGWEAMATMARNAPNLTRLVIRNITLKEPHPSSEKVLLHDDHIPMIFELLKSCPRVGYFDLSQNGFTDAVFEKVSSQDTPDQVCQPQMNHLERPPGKLPVMIEMIASCPELEALDLSNNKFTEQLINKLASQYIPGNLRRLYFRDFDKPPGLLALLERQTRLEVWTSGYEAAMTDNDGYCKDDKVCHYLDMNQFGCRGVAIKNVSLWPLLIERMGELEEDNSLQTDGPNMIYHVLRQHHSDLFQYYHQNHKKWHRDCENRIGTLKRTIDELQTELQEQNEQMQQKNEENKRLRLLLQQHGIVLQDDDEEEEYEEDDEEEDGNEEEDV